MTIFERVRILPLLVIVAFFSFAVRVGEFASGVGQFGAALAETKTEAPAAETKAPKNEDLQKADAKPEAKPDETANASAAPEKKEAAAVEEKKEPATVATEKTDADASKEGAEEIKWQDAGDTEEQFSDAQAQLYKDLAARRADIEKREKELTAREALLKAGEREMDQKMRQMTDIRNEIQGLLQKQTEEETARIGSLVKIYEGMKPTDAAKILDTLDINILVSVLTSMSERKSSPIMAAMTPERARAVTILMVQQNKLPSLPQ